MRWRIVLEQVENILQAGEVENFSWSRWRILLEQVSWCSGLCPTSPGSVRVEAPRRAEAQARPKNKPQEGPYHRHWIPLSEVQSKAHQGRCTQRCWSRETREREGTLKTSTEQIRGRLYIPGLDLTTAEKGKILNLWRFLKMKKIKVRTWT